MYRYAHLRPPPHIVALSAISISEKYCILRAALVLGGMNLLKDTRGLQKMSWSNFKKINSFLDSGKIILGYF